MAQNLVSRAALAELKSQQDKVLELRAALRVEEEKLRELEVKYNKAVSDSSNWK